VFSISVARDAELSIMVALVSSLIFSQQTIIALRKGVRKRKHLHDYANAAPNEGFA
jgi:hypothetical protein